MKELLHKWNQSVADQEEPFRSLDEISSEVYDYVVDAARQPLLPKDDPAYTNLSKKTESKTKTLLKKMIKEILKEELRIDSNPDQHAIINAIDDPNYLVSFTDIPKVGINPTTRYNTPAGIYGWHWTRDTIEKASKNKLFGSERPYAQLLKIKDGAKVLWLADDAKTGKIPNIDEAADIFFNQYPELGEEVWNFIPSMDQPARLEPFINWLKDNFMNYAKTSDRNHGGGSDTEQLYDFTMVASRLLADEYFNDAGKRTILANKMLRLLGFDAVIDTNAQGIIHKNEAAQGFFTHKGGLDHVATIDNKIYSLPATATMSILTNPKSPRAAIEKALTAVLEVGEDIKSDPVGGAKFSMHDRLDILDWATKIHKNLTSEDLTRIYNFVKELIEDNSYLLVGENIINNILGHPNVPDKLYDAAVEKMISSGDPDPQRVIEIITNSAKASPQFLKAVAEGGVVRSPNARIAALSNPNIPVDVLLPWIERYPNFFKDSRYRLATAALINPSAPRSALLDLLYDEDGKIYYNGDVFRDIVRSPNLPPEAMKDILDALKDRNKVIKSGIMASDVLESFIMSPTVPEDLVIRVLKEWEDIDGEYGWKNVAGDMIKRALRRNYTGKGGQKVGDKLLVYLRELFKKIQLDKEYDMSRSQELFIDDILMDQGAYKNTNESKDFKSLLRKMITEEIEIRTAEKKQDIKQIAKAVIYSGDQVLLIKRSPEIDNFPGHWDLPGGHLLMGENLEEGLAREIFEETNIKIIEPVKLYSAGHETFYKVEMPKSEIKLSHEHIDHKFVDIEDVPGHDELSPKYKDVIMTAMDDILIEEQLTRKFLKEGITDVVYHYTSGLNKAAKILEDNKFMASGGFTKEVEAELGKGKLYYFSTARTPVNAYTGNYPQGAIFKLDGRALSQKYKGVPVDYWADTQRGTSSKLAANVDNRSP